jgi:deoxyribonuclease IV
MSLERARDLGCSTMQIFSHNPRGWSVRRKEAGEIKKFTETRRKYDISPVYIHASYLINLSSANRELALKSQEMAVHELDIADSLEASYVVLHPGSTSGDPPETARKRTIASLSEIARKGTWKAGLLLENTAGGRGDVGSMVEDIAEILNKVPGKLISGICIDTCHAYAAGYDIASDEGMQLFSDLILKYIGKKNLKLLHLNDAKGSLGSGMDRHQHIGIGKIGLDWFRNFLHHPLFSAVPVILETPKKATNDDIRNLTAVNKLLSQSSF